MIVLLSPRIRLLFMPMPEKCIRLVQRLPGDTIRPLWLDTVSLGSFFVDVNDISVLGIGLIAATAFPVGTHFMIESGANERRLAQPLEVVLRHATQRPDGLWLLGCSFSRSLTVDDVETLG